MIQNVILIRGLPGSGKTTLAQTLAASGAFRYVEADMYFTLPDGQYIYESERIKEAHEWCFSMFRNDLNAGFSVVVSNTFTRVWEMEKYISFCKKHQIKYTVVTCEGNHGNIHGVPADAIEKMRARWEPYAQESQG